MKALIINYQRVTLPARLADWLAAAGCTPVFVDNNSTYPPLLEYYFKTKYDVLLLPKNYGHTVVWDTDLLDQLEIGPRERYIVTDPDLDLAGIPDDFLQVLHAGLDRYPRFDKCGFGLRLDDLPQTDEGACIKLQFEARYWRKPLDPLYYDAPVDTTFALYREGVRKYNHNALRTGPPYVARHIPWYYTRLRDLPADEQFYFQKATASSTGKARLKW